MSKFSWKVLLRGSSPRKPFWMLATFSVLAGTTLGQTTPTVPSGQTSPAAASISGGSSAEAQVRMYRVLAATAVRLAKRISPHAKGGVVIYDPRIVSDLPLLHSFETQLNSYALPTTTNPRAFDPTSDITALVTAIVPFFSAGGATITPVPGVSDGEFFVYGRIEKSLSVPVYYPSVVPVTLATDDSKSISHSPVYQLFAKQATAGRLVATESSDLHRAMVVPRAALVTALGNSALSDSLKTALKTLLADLDTFPTVPIGSGPTPVAHLQADLNAANMLFTGHETDPLAVALGQIADGLKPFKDLDQIVQAKAGLDAMVASLGSPAPVVQPGAANAPSAPATTATQSGDSLAVVLWRGWQYEHLTVDLKYPILRVKVESTVGTDRVDKLGYNISSRRESASAALSFSLFQADGQILHTGFTLGFLPFVLDAESATGTPTFVDDDDLDKLDTQH